MKRPHLARGMAGAVFLAVSVSTTLPASAAETGNGQFDNLVLSVQMLQAVYPAFALCHWTAEPEELEFIYGDTDGIVHHMTTKDGSLHEHWRSHPLDGRIREVFVADLNGDGTHEFIAYTSEPNIYVWERGSYDLLWEARATDEDFGLIQAMTIANVDDDPTLELVLAVDGRIVYYDGAEFFREQTGRDEVDPSEIIVADVDADGEDEVVTNDGYVFDVRTMVIEWSTASSGGFGYPMRLFDIDNDGIPEVVGETRGALKFWDIDEQREIWAPPR